MSGVSKKQTEDARQKVLQVAVEAGAQVSREDIDICDRGPSQTMKDGERCPKVSKFASRQAKLGSNQVQAGMSGVQSSLCHDSSASKISEGTLST